MMAVEATKKQQDGVVAVETTQQLPRGDLGGGPGGAGTNDVIHDNGIACSDG